MTYEEAIAELKTSYCAECPAAIENNTCYENECEKFLSIEALQKQIPKKPIFAGKIYEHHDWLKDDDGNIDDGAWTFGYCNGPVCKRCYKSFCIYCDSDNYESLISEKCVCSHYECPTCHKEVEKGIKRCLDCGQAIDWSEVIQK